MPLKFYMDEHVQRAITIGLRIRGIDVLTTQEDEREGTDDSKLLDRASELGRVMFSFDADMLRETTQRYQSSVYFAGLFFAHPTQISVGECIQDLEIAAKIAEPEDMNNQVVYLPL